MTSRRPSFNVVIPNGELAQIRRWVLEHPNKETGGDLFGLWSKTTPPLYNLCLVQEKGVVAQQCRTFNIQNTLLRVAPL